jgi:membrane-associated HD superfamily phosphohydrolase
MGGLFGIIGMIIGVPVFATIIIVTKRHLEKRLRSKDLPTATEDYMSENSMSDTDIIFHKQDGTWINKIKQSRREHKEKKAKMTAAKTTDLNSEVENEVNTVDEPTSLHNQSEIHD